MTDRILLSEDDNALAAEYVLGVLAADERAAFKKRLASDAGLATAVRHWEEHFAGFAEEIAPVATPPALQSRLEDRLFGKPKTQSGLSQMWNSLGLWRGLAVASLVGLVAISTWSLQKAQQVGNDLVATVAGDQAGVTLAAFYDTARGELRLNRVNGQAADGRALELWLIAGNDAPVSLGVLPADNTTRVLVPTALRAKLKDGTLAISDEPLGGSTTGAPTGAVLATGKLTII
jgi:anti-sigma-K factor RskA